MEVEIIYWQRLALNLMKKGIKPWTIAMKWASLNWRDVAMKIASLSLLTGILKWNMQQWEKLVQSLRNAITLTLKSNLVSVNWPSRWWSCRLGNYCGSTWFCRVLLPFHWGPFFPFDGCLRMCWTIFTILHKMGHESDSTIKHMD